MIWLQHQDYYIFELAKLMDGRLVIPTRWYMKCDMTGAAQPFGEGWEIFPVCTEQGQRGYIVHEFSTVHFAAHQLSLSMLNLVATFANDNLPDPQCIIGMCVSRAITYPLITLTHDQGLFRRLTGVFIHGS